MRSRPRVKLSLAPGVIYPGTTFRADLLVEGDGETPCEFVDIRLQGYEQMVVRRGNAPQMERRTFTDLHVRHEPKLLAPGARTFSGRFTVPESRRRSRRTRRGRPAASRTWKRRSTAPRSSPARR